jgi:nicotinate-nucleotide adenylyltransferase
MKSVMSQTPSTEPKTVALRLGILGGTFDPPHIGHMLMAQDAMDSLSLDGVIFVPAGQPPHKDSATISPASHRLKMLRHASAWNPAFTVDDLELNAQGKTYTIDTLQALRTKHPGAELFFLIGSDSLADLQGWMRIHELLPLCRFITYARPGQCMQKIRTQVAKLPDPWATQLLQDIQLGHEINVSSSEIRQRVSAKQSIRYLVPAEVEGYIERHELYKTQVQASR